MRLSTVCFLCIAILLVGSVAFAQHHETGSTPSAPSPSPAPSPIPNFSPPSPPSAPSASHSEPSVSAPVSAPIMHSAPEPSPPPSPIHNSIPSSSATSNSTRTAPESKPQSDAAGSVSAKSPETSKIVSNDRTVETPALKKTVESDIRHRVCTGEKCPDAASEAQNAQPPQDDMRRCILCKCP